MMTAAPTMTLLTTMRTLSGVTVALKARHKTMVRVNHDDINIISTIH